MLRDPGRTATGLGTDSKLNEDDEWVEGQHEHVKGEKGGLISTRPRISRAPGTSPDIQRSLAHMSQRTSACGQNLTARASSSSKLSRVPCAFSHSAARLRIQ